MNGTSGLLLVAAVAAVGVLHTIVPDHWVPITLIARQRGWSKAETARVSFRAGLGHVLSTLAIAAVVWIAGVSVASRFGHWVDTIASIALVAFGGWIAVSAWRDLHGHGGHTHHHGHSHGGIDTNEVSGAIHGPELQRIDTEHGPVELSIFEAGVPPRFRLTAPFADSVVVETLREDGSRQDFDFIQREGFWESIQEIPEPHGFEVSLSLDHAGHAHTYRTQFVEHNHDDHGHHHDEHGHSDKQKSRTALLLILGSSPMVEGIPAFFAASKYGIGLIVVMSIVFGVTTIATYMLLCVYSTAGLQRIRLGALERYGEVLSGAFIALVGVVFWIWPVL
jgi:nickel/cobalt transporter (NicO) family protein